jgi:hypothetical protein
MVPVGTFSSPLLQNLMPHELVDFSPLGLARAETFDDFRRALLVKSRYGRFLVNRRHPSRAL